MELVKIEAGLLIPEIYERIEQEIALYALEKTGFDGGTVNYCFQAHQDDRMVGIIEGRTFWGTLYIRRLLVFPEFRMRGIGRKLVEASLAYGKEQKCSCVFVETMHFQALKFYEKFGFIVELARKGFCRDATLYYLRKDLTTKNNF